MGIIRTIQTDLTKSALQLIVECRERLYSIAYRECGNAADAEDLVSQTIAKAIQKLDGNTEVENLFAWLRAMMLNLRKDEMRRAVVRGTQPVESEQLESYAGADWSTDEKILKDSDSEAIHQAIEELDPKYRQAMLMRYYEDFSFKEIAQILKLPMGTVSRRIQIAHHLLAAKLGSKLGRKPIAVLLAALLGVGTLFGAWQAGVAMIEARSETGRAVSMKPPTTENNQTTLTTTKEEPAMNIKTLLAAPLLVTTLTTSAAVDVTPFIPEGVTPETPSAGVYTYEYDNDRIVIFADPGNYEFTVPEGASAISYLVVGGGGSGGGGSSGSSTRGGGGAGGLLQGTISDPTLPANFAITVGSGGVAKKYYVGNSGGNSSLSGAGLSAKAKGGGGSENSSVGSGGSGGGGSGSKNMNGGSGENGQGNKGGDGINGASCGAGGGGAGGPGAAAGDGQGGIGLALPITGKEVWYAAGGAGQKSAYEDGYCGSAAGNASGRDGTGGGGGGEAGRGGSGIVVIRCIYKAMANYTLTLEDSPLGSITANPSQDEYLEGSIVSLTATPQDESVGFIRWGGDATGSEKSTTITMDGNKTVSAVFGYKLAITPSGFGTIVGATSGDVFEPGADVSLTAVPNEGCSFVSWGGDASGSEPTITVTMDRPRTVIAYYKDAAGHTYTEWGYSNTVRIAGKKYCVSVFNTVGNHTWTLPIKKASAIDYLVVGGGGGSGSGKNGRGGAGGGAGGMIYKEGVKVAGNTEFSIQVGAGGVGGTSYSDGGNGGNSVLEGGEITETAFGGGGGGAYSGGKNGGCGGGASMYATGSGGTGSQGFNGGMNTVGVVDCAAGGGGMGGPGGNAGDPNDLTCGNGGEGLPCSITGEDEEVWYAGGGAGGGSKANRLGGKGGGGNTMQSGTNGLGGGGGAPGNGSGFAGGSGVVIIRYALPSQGVMIMLF